MTDEPARPPLPTRAEVAAAPVQLPGPALLRFVRNIQPAYDLREGRCVGQAPRFDTDRLEGETQADYKERIEWAQEQCRSCPILAKCGIRVPSNADGVWAGELRRFGKRPATKASNQ